MVEDQDDFDVTTPGIMKLTILFGSQKGNAQEIAGMISRDLTDENIGLLDTPVVCMADYLKEHKALESLRSEECVVIVCSTTGQGDAPDNAERFYRKLCRYRKQEGNTDFLKGLHFSVLGLGDSNYDNFCKMGKQFDKLFHDLGASRFYRRGVADDGTGLEDVVEPWKSDLVPALTQLQAALQKNESVDVKNDGPWEPLMQTNLTATTEDGKENKETPAANSSASAATTTATAAAPSAAMESEEGSQAPSSPATAESTPSPYSSSAASTPAAVAPAAISALDISTLDLSPKTMPKLPKCNVSVALVGGEDEKAEESDSKMLTGNEYFLDLWCDEASREVLMEGDRVCVAATVSAASILTSSASTDRTVVHMELSMPTAQGNSNSSEEHLYLPGDAVGIHCPNNAGSVASLLTRLGLGADAVVASLSLKKSNSTTPSSSSSCLAHVNAPVTVSDLFTYCLDITSIPKKSFLRLLAECCTDATEQQKLLYLSSRPGKELFRATVEAQRAGLEDMLAWFPSCTPSLDQLVSLLPDLKPRYYSASSSPLMHPSTIHFAFTVVPDGLCTQWLYGIAEQSGLLQEAAGPNSSTSPPQTVQLPVFIRPGNSFRVPVGDTAPVLMIGPGTGVSPFRGFCQHWNAESGDAGFATRTVLYHGCRHKDQDFLYSSELQQFAADHKDDATLSQLHVAFSRAQEEKQYVQHLLRANAQSTYDDIVEQEARVFVCGDGVRMAKDVMATITDIIAQGKGNFSPDADKEAMHAEAQSYVFSMVREGRYVQDIWS